MSEGDSEFSLLVLADPVWCVCDCPPDASFDILGNYPVVSDECELFEPGYVEFGFSNPSPQLAASMHTALQDNEHLVIRSYKVDERIEVVIVKENNVLGLGEARKHSDACKASMLAELTRWTK